jgi:hypothetical protein
VQTRVQLKFPAYTGMKPKEVDTLNLELPEGTEVAWQLRCDRPIGLAELLSEEAKPLAMKLDPDGMVASHSFTATEPFSYRFRWTEREHSYVYDTDVSYFVQVITDGPPEVEIITPIEDEKATVNKRVGILFRAVDDYGIAEAWIVYQVNDGSEQKRPIGTFDRQQVEKDVPWPLKETIPDIKEGDTVTFANEVADKRTGKEGPNISRTRPLRVSVVSLEEYLRYILERRAKLVKELQALQKEETEASGEVKVLQETPVEDYNKENKEPAP